MLSQAFCYYRSMMWRIASNTSLKVAQRHCRFTYTRHNEVTRASSSSQFLPWKSFEAEAGNPDPRPLASSNRRDNPRFLSSTTTNQEHKPRTKSKHAEINDRIIAFGRNNNWRGILNLYEENEEEFNHVNYATSMSQLGRIQALRRNDRRLEEMMITIATQLHSPKNGLWGAQGMANTLHAVAKLKLKSEGSRRLTDAILGEVNLEVLLEKANCQVVANLAWACARLAVKCPLLFKTIDNNAFYFVDNGTPQAIANTIWACAKLEVQCPSFFKAIDNYAFYLVENGNSQDIANTAWACARLRVECQSLFKAIGNDAVGFVAKGTSQNIANAAWACATLGVQCPLLFKAIDKNALDFVAKGNSREIANTAWACAKLRTECPSLFKTIDNNALDFVVNGNNHEISNMKWAFTTLGVECPSLLRAIDDKALGSVD